MELTFWPFSHPRNLVFRFLASLRFCFLLFDHRPGVFRRCAEQFAAAEVPFCQVER